VIDGCARTRSTRCRITFNSISNWFAGTGRKTRRCGISFRTDTLSSRIEWIPSRLRGPGSALHQQRRSFKRRRRLRRKRSRAARQRNLQRPSRLRRSKCQRCRRSRRHRTAARPLNNWLQPGRQSTNDHRPKYCGRRMRRRRNRPAGQRTLHRHELRTLVT